MAKPYGRKTRKKVFRILDEYNRSEAMELLAQIPDEQLTGHLFSHFYNSDERIKFRSTAAMGQLAARIFSKNPEKARIILRRIMWNLNDESGGIGWGSPEAMGEILKFTAPLRDDFGSILLSYLDPGGNFIEHEMLQRGVLWGVGTYLEAAPDVMDARLLSQVSAHLHSDDPVKRGYAVRTLLNANQFDCSRVPEHIVSDHEMIDIFTGWNFIPTRISDMALACTPEKMRA